MIIPGSCSSGLRSRPSGTAGSRRSNGFEVMRVKERKPTLTQPSTLKTRAMNASGSLLLKMVAATVHNDRVSAHSRSEPSWLPHTPVMR